MRHVGVLPEPVMVADSRPRGLLWPSLLPPSSLCPMLRTSTDTTLSLSGRTASAGNTKSFVDCSDELLVRTVPRWVPLSHTAQAPALPVPARREMPFSSPLPVKCPRYHV